MAMAMGLGEAVETGGEGAGLEEGEPGEEEEGSEEEPSEEGVVGLIRPVKDLSIWLDENQVSHRPAAGQLRAGRDWGERTLNELLTLNS